MDTLTADIRRIGPTDPEVAGLIAAHLSLMRASSPACSVHAMAPEDLAEAGAQFFAAFQNEQAVAIGALKILSADHGELKSMHVRADLRGTGLADAMLKTLLTCAQGLGLTRISLETGSQPAFQAARAFYARHDFEKCAPFGSYELDPHSVFMTRSI